MSIPIPLTKLKAIMLYFANNTNPRYAGKIKFMKLFYFLDFLHVKKYLTPVTGDQYFNLDKGPIPAVILHMIDELLLDPESSKIADTIAVETPKGSKMQKIIPLRKFTNEDVKLFSKSEIIILKEVVRRFKNTDTDTIIKLSHAESPWKDTNYRDPIPYSLAGRDPDSVYTEAEIKELNSL